MQDEQTVEKQHQEDLGFLDAIGLTIIEEEHCIVSNISVASTVLRSLIDLDEEIKESTFTIFRETIQNVVDNEVSGLIGIISPIAGNNIDHILVIEDMSAWSIYLETIGV